MQKRLANTGFETLYGLADGAGSDAKLVGGFAKAAIFCDREEFRAMKAATR